MATLPLVPAPGAAPTEAYFFPASSAQHRLWFLEQLQPGRALYNVPIAVRMTGPLDAAVLEHSLQELIARHETLRTSFALQQDQPVQIVAPALPFKLSVTDLRLLPAEAREAQACALARAEAQRPFDLRHPPLFGLQLLKLTDTEHILVLTVHHIIFDGWSLTVFFRELAALYTASRAGRPAALPELAVQYGDFTVWQRERFKALSSRLAWWKEQLAGSPAVLELPADRPRPAVQGYHGRVETLALPAALREPLEALSRREGVTLFMTLLAAFQVLLHRHTGQTDLLIGTPVAGRNRKETEAVLGLFINTLVLRGDLGGNPTFRELLGRVRTTVLDALAHEEVPFERIVEKLSPERSLNRAPLFQVMFVHERSPLEPVQWPGLQLAQLELDSGTAKFDLTLYLVESASGLTARAEYDSDLFEPATIRRLLAHLAGLLQSGAAQPDQRIGELPLLADAERRQLLTEWNHTAADYPREQTVHGLIATQAARTPDAIAVQAGHRRLTYRQLLEESGRLARQLQAAGVRPGVLVGLCVDRSPAMLVSLLGILQAGGAYVPLDPAFPKERLAFMLEDSQAPVVVTEHRWLELLPHNGAHFICLDEEPVAPPSAPGLPFTPPAHPVDLAYVIYTSGSTGRPKGVQVSHSAVVNFLCSMQRTPGLTATDSLLAVTTLSFDIAALELYLPLTVGARIVLASREEAADAARLAALITASRVTVMQATPATWRMLVQSGWAGVKTLRIFCGGEALTRDLADRLLARCTELWNLYGPTETTIWSAVARVEPGAHPVVIGRPIANTQLHVLDRQDQLVPVGVPGELCIGGDGLARGYLHRPELTTEKFIPDPFAARPHARLYRTGDLARRRPNGEIELLGRLDHQVKVRGFRIELGEIEAALRRLPAVREAVVVAREDTPGDQQLVAYLVADPAAAAPGELRRHLRETLPDYMMPAAFVLLERMPLTPNGKVNRPALPAPAAPGAAPAAGSAALREGLEQGIAAIWSEVLKVKHPGADDNFFDLGGHSLRVAQVQTKLREQLGIELPMLALFQYPTIRSLARCIGEKPGEGLLHQQATRRAAQQRAAVRRKPAPAAVPAPARP